MKYQNILMVVIALVLGMLVANMLKDVCGCKDLIEGQGCLDSDTGCTAAIPQTDFCSERGMQPDTPTYCSNWCDPNSPMHMDYLLSGRTCEECCTPGSERSPDMCVQEFSDYPIPAADVTAYCTKPLIRDQYTYPVPSENYTTDPCDDLPITSNGISRYWVNGESINVTCHGDSYSGTGRLTCGENGFEGDGGEVFSEICQSSQCVIPEISGLDRDAENEHDPAASQETADTLIRGYYPSHPGARINDGDSLTVACGPDGDTVRAVFTCSNGVLSGNGEEFDDTTASSVCGGGNPCSVPDIPYTTSIVDSAGADVKSSTDKYAANSEMTVTCDSNVGGARAATTYTMTCNGTTGKFEPNDEVSSCPAPNKCNWPHEVRRGDEILLNDTDFRILDPMQPTGAHGTDASASTYLSSADGYEQLGVVQVTCIGSSHGDSREEPWVGGTMTCNDGEWNADNMTCTKTPQGCPVSHIANGDVLDTNSAGHSGGHFEGAVPPGSYNIECNDPYLGGGVITCMGEEHPLWTYNLRADQYAICELPRAHWEDGCLVKNRDQEVRAVASAEVGGGQN